WRLAFLKLLLALVWVTPVGLPLLPAERTGGGLASSTTDDRRPTTRYGGSVAVWQYGSVAVSEGSEPPYRHGPTPWAPPTLPYSPLLALLWLAGAACCAARVGREAWAAAGVRRRAAP